MLSFIKYKSFSKGSIERAYGLWNRTDAGLIPTPVFLPGKSNGQRILVGYSSRGCKTVGHN